MSGVIAGAKPLKSPTAQKVCNLAGLDVARKKLLTLSDLKNSIDADIKVLDASRTQAEREAAGILLGRLIKSSCDAFISLAVVLSPKATEKQAEIFQSGYNVVSSFAEAASSGNGYQKVAMAAVKAGAKPLAKKIGQSSLMADYAKDFGEEGAEKISEFMLNQGVIPTQIMVDAVNDDSTEVMKGVKDYAAMLAKLPLDLLEEKVKGKFVDIGSAMFDYHLSLNEAFEQNLKIRDELNEIYITNVLIMRRSAHSMMKKINETEEFIKSCSEKIDSNYSKIKKSK